MLTVCIVAAAGFPAVIVFVDVVDVDVDVADETNAEAAFAISDHRLRPDDGIAGKGRAWVTCVCAALLLAFC